MEREPRPGGRIVEAGNFATRYEAQSAMRLLEENGIQASGKFGDADGWAPNFALVDGYRVLVFDDDLEKAKELLAEEALAEAETEADPDPESG